MADQQNTGGMVALVPSDDHAQQMAVDGGLDPGDLHLTLVYLGDDVTDWDDDQQQQVVDSAQQMASAMSPVQGRAFAHAGFNPDGYQDRPPCAVYLIGDAPGLSDARDALAPLASADQHEPFVPHVTAGEGIDPSGLSFTGPVTFDKMRVAMGDQVTDMPLTGEADQGDGADNLAAAVSAKQRSNAQDAGDTYPGTDKFPVKTRDQFSKACGLAGNSDLPGDKVRKWLMSVAKRKGWTDLIPDTWNPDGSLTAAATAPEAVPIEWFRDPGLDGPTPLTVADDGRVYGHLATWQSDHIGFPGKRIKPPRSAADYAYFHTGSRLTADGEEQRPIATGHITLDTGHAEMTADARAASAHYDNTGSLAADVCAGEDAHGIWVAGATVPGLDELRLHKLRACGLSGDWRRIGAGLELVAALSVPTPGFPIPRSRVASAGEPVALVAAGAMAPAPVLDQDSIAEAVVARLDRRDADRAEREALTAALLEDDTAERLELMADLVADDLEGLTASADVLTAAQNWVQQTGGLPQYIKRISDHLRAKGMDQSRSIAVAVNAAKRMCATGDLNFPGLQQVNAGSKAEACAAVADWERKKAQSHAT
jgi:hypothetical protein